MTARELIDIIAPQHDRTSCNDDSLQNAITNDHGYYRCVRCVLLDGHKHGFAPTTTFEMSAHHKYITDAVKAVHAAEQNLEAARRNLQKVR